jgi:tetratricopeptide (TPR) repeat protein
VNGKRVDRAEVPIGAEISIGDYRLTVEKDSGGRSAAVGGATVAREVKDLGDLQIRERSDQIRERSDHVTAAPLRHSRAAAPAPAATLRTWPASVMLLATALILFAAAAWMWGGRGADTTDPPRTTDPRAADPAQQPSAAVPQDPQPAPQEPAEPFTPKANSPRRPPPPLRTPQQRVARKPGESVEAWRTRGEALETRYAYSRAALDRRDYAAAAGGFQAILLEEPGFLDTAQLLVQANAGLRSNATGLYESGRKLEANGDVVGALQKYEQARQIYSGIPGIADAVQRAREKLYAAGTKAYAEAKQLDAMGRTADALKEYEKAVRWLPPDDPNRQSARARIEQLRKTQ